MAFTANGENFNKGLSLFVPFASMTPGHEQNCVESEFVILNWGEVLILFLSVIWEFCEAIMF